MTFEARDSDADRVAWTVLAEDPWSIIHRPDDADPDAGQDVARRVAEEYGLALEYVIDTDDIGGVNYYEYALVVPRDRQGAQPGDAPPPGVTAVLDALREALPHPSLRWSVNVDGGLTWLLQASADIRQAHRPLIEAMERVLLPLRVDGAEAMDPNISVSRLAGGQVQGLYSAYLCEQPDSGTWCLMKIGIAEDLPFAPSHDRQHDAARGSLVLPMPPPTEQPVVYGAEVTTGPFHGLSTRWESARGVVGWGPKRQWDTVGSRHQWLANDPDALAEKIARTVELWWPDGATPPGCLGASDGPRVRRGFS
jgi:hypothetical protein